MRRHHAYRSRDACAKRSAKREKDQVLRNILEPAIGSGKREEDMTPRKFLNNVLTTALTVKAKAQTAAAVVEAKAPTLKAAAVAAATEVVVQMKNPRGTDKGERGRSGCDAIVVDNKMVESICALGFSVEEARLALTRSKGNVDVACNSLFEASECKESSQGGCTHDTKNIGLGSASCGMDCSVGSDSGPPSSSSDSLASTTASSSATLSPEEYLDLVQDGSGDEEEGWESNALHSKFCGRWLANSGMQPLIFGSNVTLSDGIHARMVFHSANSSSMKLNGEIHHADVEENRMVWSNGDVWIRLASLDETQGPRHVTHSPRAESCDSDDDGRGLGTQSWTSCPASQTASGRHAGGGDGDASEVVVAHCAGSSFELEGEEEVLFSAESEASSLAAALADAKSASSGDSSEGEAPRSDALPRRSCDESVSTTVTCDTPAQSALNVPEDSVQTESRVVTVIGESVENLEDLCLPPIKDEQSCDIDNRDELEAGLSSDGGGAWDWPLSRQEKKSRVHHIERQMQMIDRKTLLQELVELRLLWRRQQDIVEGMTSVPKF
eukprot:TRINITY_DN16001_c0_g2_i1.p1 TRINITY_DN16001_c0_g2~~TRINITY_DN16001_c0_g2_i1.p1  ORF type:complete len:554 (+),score=104.10 TRINITY_DN16001_c0_g2_i1:101-1762(+)